MNNLLISFTYTVVGHGTLNRATGINQDAHWQLTVMSNIDGAFHVCDNEDPCKALHIPYTQKIHVDEIFFPNRRNILGGIHLSVTKHESVSFRAAASSPENIFSLIRQSARDLNVTSARSIFKTGKQRKVSPPHKSSHRSLGKMKQLHDSKFYSIEVTCPSGWPLTLAQWKRVDEPTKIMSAKEKERVMPLNFGVHQPLPGDAFVELECAFAVGGGVVAKRDDERDQNFVNARKAWDAREHGRNARGAQIRKQFREEFLVIPPPEISESTRSGLDSSIRSSNMDTDVMDTLSKDAFEEMENEETKDLKDSAQGQGPTPATESGMLEMSVEAEEEAVYLTMPELLRDNFKPLNFLPFCMKEKESYDSVIVTSDMAKAAAKERQARIEAAKERMKELQLYNEEHVLGRQKDRCFALEKLFVGDNFVEAVTLSLILKKKRKRHVGLGAKWKAIVGQIGGDRHDSVRRKALKVLDI
ncbi:hypothetical protein HF086_007859 [Spodoptera exigua]|uniref:Uncharacterized protein n=1 Tax=Spodoptera exigua TaxID=7107 RepID=A0A922S8X4_SPOEX|nr:hypothetical protein HF086_007859 [Spodoptera exigua]